MTDLEMLKRAKNIKGLLESGRCSDANEELDNIICKLKVDLSMKKYSKASDRQALKLMQKLTSKKNSWIISNYLKIENEYMYWTDAYIAVQLKLDEAWEDSLPIYEGEGYPAIRTFFEDKEFIDCVKLTLSINDVMYLKKTVDKIDGHRIVKLDCYDMNGEKYNCSFDVQNLENLFTIMRADELTFKANKKVGANNDIVNAFETENEYGKAVIVTVRNYEGGEKNE
jgi:hypothetical protein